jgi:ubiquitin-protein ligase
MNRQLTSDKELAKIHESTAPGITFVKAENLYKWLMDIRVLDNNPLYTGKTFRLEFRFGQNYPIEPPEVVFLPAPVREEGSRPLSSSASKFTGFLTSAAAAVGRGEGVMVGNGSASATGGGVQDSGVGKQAGPKTNSVLDSTGGTEQWDGVPIHPHIYSNGIICLDLLDKAAWSPVHNVESVCISLQSMLTSNNKNERPPNDREFCKSNSLRPKDIRFLFHDDGV